MAALTHTLLACVVTAFIQNKNIEVINWPTVSSDLTLTEHVWDDIGRRLLRLPNQSLTLEQLADCLVMVMFGLRYLGKGDFFSEVADLHGISKQTASRLFTNFIDAINLRLDNISFSTTRLQLEETKLGFFKRADLPGVIGAIDGTLVPIIAPKQHEDVYVCRKGFHAINVQAAVDNTMRFTDVVSRWHGSQHDSSIFNTSGLKNYLEMNQLGHLIGDSGYALKQYLLTLVLRPTTPQERRYNDVHSRTRVVVERAFGLLKSRFRMLFNKVSTETFTLDAQKVGLARKDANGDDVKNHYICKYIGYTNLCSACNILGLSYQDLDKLQTKEDTK